MEMTNVKGIMKDHVDEKTLMPTLTERKIENMIKSGSVSAGMIPKRPSGTVSLFMKKKQNPLLIITRNGAF